jgi:NAD(P)-dependent dehydrogenase (short-subunit alcohol dehydrogenase family)
LSLHIENAEKIAIDVKALGQNAIALGVDVADFQAVNTAVRKVQREFKHIDILINGAGYGQYVPFAEMSEEIWDRSIAVHLKGTFNCTRAVINGMINRRYGKILNISSVTGIVGLPKHTQYAAAKAGVIGLTKSLAREVAEYRININALAPGPVKTAFQEPLRKHAPEILKMVAKSIPLGRRGNVEEFAAIILFLCSEDASFITGQVISPNGGYAIF